MRSQLNIRVNKDDFLKKLGLADLKNFKVDYKKITNDVLRNIVLPEPTPGKPGKKGDSGEPGSDGSPDSGEEIIRKINAVRADGPKIGAEHMTGLSMVIPMGGGTGVSSGSGTLAIGSSVTSGTTGSVLFVDSSGTLAQDNSNFYWDDTINVLGIGISGASIGATRLHVNGGSMYFGDETNTAQHIFFRRNAATIGGLSQQSSVMTMFGGTTPASHITIGSTGIVGIGTTTTTNTALIAMGGSPSSLTRHQAGIAYSPVATTGTQAGLVIQTIASPAGSFSGLSYGSYIDSGVQAANANTFTANPIGLSSYGGTVTHRGSNTVTGASIYNAASPAVTGGGTITTMYGLYINRQKIAAGVTTGYGIFQADSNDINTFAGNMSIGTTSAPTAALSVTGSITGTGSITLTSAGSNGFNLSRAAVTNSTLQIFQTNSVDQWVFGLRNDSTNDFHVRDSVNSRTFIKLTQTGGLLLDPETGVGIGAVSATTFFNLPASTTGLSSMRMIAGVAPTSPVEGDMWADSTQKTVYGFIAGIKQSRSGAIFSQTADQSVTNTVTETTMIGAGVGTLTLPANFFTIGKTIRIKLSGVYSTVAVTGDTVTVKVKYGSTVIATKATSSLLTGATNLSWWGEIVITCRTTGATGTVQPSGSVRYQASAAGVLAEDELNNGAATVTIDTTASSALNVTVTHSAANASNTIKSLTATVEILN